MKLIGTTLYCLNGDNPVKIDDDIVFEEDIIDKENIFYPIFSSFNTLSATFRIVGFNAKEVSLVLSGLYDDILSSCTNRRVRHLAKNAKKKKIRSKNLNRIMRMIEKGV